MSFDSLERIGQKRSQEFERVFLVSDRGWSLYFNVAGDHDPGDVRCELLRISKGVPTSSRTKVQKTSILGAPYIRPSEYRPPRTIETSGSYEPRCLSQVTKRTEYYSARAKDFWISIRYDVDESAANLEINQKATYQLYESYNRLHLALFSVLKTLPCDHNIEPPTRYDLDLGVATSCGLMFVRSGTDWGNKSINRHRICIVLTYGDRRARWLAITGNLADPRTESMASPHSNDRRVMLRCNRTCPNCAVKAAAAMSGKWFVIL